MLLPTLIVPFVMVGQFMQACRYALNVANL